MPIGFWDRFFDALLNAWAFVRYLAPFLAGGILFGALVSTFVPREKPARMLSSGKWWMLPAAGAVGLVSPACTYGTVPVFVEMIKAGAPMAPAATFLVASALVNPQIFFLTAGALGIWIAVVQAAASLAFSILIGLLVARAAARGIDLEGSELKAARRAELDRASEPVAHTAQSHRRHRHAMLRSLSWPRRLALSVLDLTEFVGFYFLIGTLVASLAAQFIPAGTVLAAVGQGRWWAVPLATVVSIPTYICGGGTIPFLARASEMGMASGAVLAFLIAGPATRVTALSALAVLFKKRAVLIYAALLLLFASALGIALGPFVAVGGAARPAPY